MLFIFRKNNFFSFLEVEGLSSATFSMPLAHSHPWQPMPVKEEDNNVDPDAEVRVSGVVTPFVQTHIFHRISFPLCAKFNTLCVCDRTCRHYR